MLEKIGLPEKPSMRGAAWVIDASHCQGCSSQFTFINRKHHCRRCGGLFCGSCTHQRMVLRGQGDSPVRICDPCKKLEDAARFELRYGRKNRSAKGNPKPVLKQEEEILGQILGTDGKQSLLSGHESTADVFSGLRKITSGASSSSSKEECTEIDMFRSMSVGMDNNDLNNFQSSSPEELRNKAAGEKNAYRILKGEGKSEEALQAFKRSKELERQAGALEIALRKSRRMASKAPNLSAVSGTPKTDVHEESSSKKLNSSRRGKDDIAAELLGLGWSDADLHDADKKAANLSLEGELSNLIGEMPKKSSPFKADNSQVIAHKKKALVLKREGKLAEAKEELKRAKILEKQLEEQELLGGDEDPDDELSALIYSMDDEDKHDDLLPNCSPDRDINFENIFIVADDPSIDGGFDVTDDDMNDPELASALKSFGWTDEEDGHAADQTRLDSEALQCEVVTLKREALSQKRAGNITEAMQLLKKAKLLEKDLESMQTNDQTIASDIENAKKADEEIVRERKTAPKSKLMIQKELLGLKKKALALRREGRVHEAEEELEKGKGLEQQLEDIENAPKRPEVQTRKNLDLDDLEAEVTEQDMHDPALLSVLKNLGWNEDNVESTSTRNKASKQKPTRNKAEIQKELLGIKRKSLALRHQGKAEEAEEELERAKILENQLAEMEASSMDMGSNGFGSSIAMENPNRERAVDDVVLSSVSVGKVLIDNEFPLPDIDSVKSYTAKAPVGFESQSSEDQGIQSEERSEESVSIITQSSSMIGFLPGSEVKTLKEDSDRNAFPLPTVAIELSKAAYDQKTEILAHKRKALALKREGKISEAREELRRAKILEKSLEDPEVAIVGSSNENDSASTSAEASFVQESRMNQAPKVLSSRDRFKLQQESLSHKRNALRLRREGKIAESEAEFELAKSLESQLEVENSKAIVGSKMDDVVVEDMIDPQLMSALKSIGWQDADMESKASMGKSGKPNSQITQLEEEVKAEKVRALNLKRAGKQGEALEALRYAKKLEKKLESLAP